MAPSKDAADCASPATTASIKPSWADLSEDLDDTGLDTDSLERDEAHSALSDLETTAFQSLNIPKPRQRTERRSRREAPDRKAAWKPTVRGKAVQAAWSSSDEEAQEVLPQTPKSNKKNTEKKKDCGSSSAELEIPEDFFAVRLAGMPARLCNEACLEVMLHQAGLQTYLLSQAVKMGPEGGEAVIVVSGWEACLACYQHFVSSSWVGEALEVTMHAPRSWEKEFGSLEELVQLAVLVNEEGYDCSTMGVSYFYTTGSEEEWCGSYGLAGAGSSYYNDYTDSHQAHQQAAEAARAHAKDLAASRQNPLFA